MIKRYIILHIMLVFCFASCKESKTDNNCESKAKIHNTEICLPKINGLLNIYEKKDDEIYLKYSDIISKLTTMENGLLAFYIEKSDTGYSSLYYNKTVDNDLSKEEYQIIAETMGKYLKKTDFLGNIRQFLEEKFENFSVDIPVTIEQYSLNENMTTYLILQKSNEQNEDIYTLKTLNLIYIKGKIVIFNYIVGYNNFETINELKQKNDYFVTRLLDYNN